MPADPLVALTLIALRFGQQHFSGPKTAGILQTIAAYPAPQIAKGSQVEPLILGVERPFLAAATSVPDQASVWPLAILSPEQQARSEAELSGGVSYLKAKADHLGLSAEALVLVPDAPPGVAFTVADVLSWVGTVGMLTNGCTLLLYSDQCWLAFIGADDQFNVPFNPFDAVHRH